MHTLKPAIGSSMSQHRRRGVSLIELIVVISMLGTVLSLAGMTFYLLLRSEKVVSQSFVTERAISRLAVQFRDDVHQSESGTVIDRDTGPRTELKLGDANGVQVRYVVTKDGLARLLVERDAIVARDDFRLPECRVHFTAGSESESLMRTLVVERPSATVTTNSHAPRPLRLLEIQAQLNRQKMLMSGVGSTIAGDNLKSNRETTEELK